MTADEPRPAARFAAILGALLAAHDLADHVVQTDHQAATKATSWRGMAGHITGYQATQAAALAALRPLGVRPSWRRTLAGMAISAGTHALLDRRWPVLRLLELTGSSNFAFPQVDVIRLQRSRRSTGAVPLHGPYLADQALHHACLAVAAYVIAGGGHGD